MGVNWTSEQRKVIELRDRNILVSAFRGLPMRKSRWILIVSW